MADVFLPLRVLLLLRVQVFPRPPLLHRPPVLLHLRHFLLRRRHPVPPPAVLLPVFPPPVLRLPALSARVLPARAPAHLPPVLRLLAHHLHLQVHLLQVLPLPRRLKAR